MNSTLIDDLEKDIKKYCKKFGTKKTREMFEKDILNLNNPRLSYFFASNVKGANLPEHFRVIYNGDDYNSLYYFCKNFHEKLHINMEEIAKIIAEKGGVDLNYTLIKDNTCYHRSEINIDKNIRVIIDGDNYRYIEFLLSCFYKRNLNQGLNLYKFHSNYYIQLSDDDIETISEKFLKSDKLYYSYVYAVFSQEDRDISKHFNKIVESGDPKYNYLAYENIGKGFDKEDGRYSNILGSVCDMGVPIEIREIDKERNIQAIMESGNAEALYNLLRLKKNAMKHSDRIYIFEKIFETGDAKYNYELISKFYDIVNIKKHADAIINSGDANYIYKIIFKYHDKVDINKALDAIAASKNPKYNFKVSKEFSDNEKNLKAIIESGNIEYCYKAALEIENEYMEVLENVVIESGNAEYNYRYALDIPNCNLNAHLAVIINSGNPEYNYLAIQNITGANIEAHMNAILDSGDFDYIDKFEDIETVKNQSITNKIKRIGVMRGY